MTLATVFALRLVVTAEQCPHEVWAIHHLPTDLRTFLFFDRAEAERVMRRLDLSLWNTTAAKGNRELLADIKEVCSLEGLEPWALIHEDTKEVIAYAWGGPDVLLTVDEAERCWRA